MLDVLVALPRAVIGAIFLQLFFKELRTTWPQNYYSVSDLLSAGLARTWRRYALFRFTPVGVAAVVVGATGPGTSADLLSAIIGLAVLHISATAGRSIVSSQRRGQLSGSQLLADTGISLGVAASCIVGGLISGPVGRYLPGVDKYIEVLLTGVVAALAYSYLSRWTGGAPAPESRSDLMSIVPIAERDIATERAAHYKIDRDLLLAVLATEYHQRPPWIASLERHTSWTGLVKTYGPLQNMTDPSASAFDSIDAGAHLLVGAMVPRDGGWVKNPALVEAHFERFNHSKNFVEQCTSAMDILSSSVVSQADRSGSDGSPRVRCLRVERSGYNWNIHGDLSDENTQLSVLAIEPNVNSIATHEDSAVRSRRAWRATCSLEVTRIQIIVASLDGSFANPDVLEVSMFERGEL